MIHYLKRAQEGGTYHSQENNPTEQQDLKLGRKDWLQSCGPTAVANIIACQGGDMEFRSPGTYHPQPEEILYDYFNDPRNYEALEEVRPETPPSKWLGATIPQFYDVAVPAVFGVNAEFSWGTEYKSIVKSIKKGKGVVLCLKDPGHYVAVVGAGDDQVVYNDPWPGNYWPAHLKGSSPKSRQVTWEFMKENLKPFKITIG